VSVVAAHLYRNGKNAKVVSLDEPIDCKGKSEFVWIGLFEPSERELEKLKKNYGLLSWWLRGLGRPNPFFDVHTNAPLSVPRVLTPDERATPSPPVLRHPGS
jgi:hypothetical protein